MIIKFFVTPVYPYGNDHYYHEIIALAEGFEALGHKVIGNCDYWLIPEEDRYLIKNDIDDYFDIAIYDHRYVKSFEHLLFRKGYSNFDITKKHILIDRMEDWLEAKWAKNPHYEIFDLIFSCNLVKGFKIPENVRPWAMGLTNRMVKSIDENESSLKNESIGFNSRVSHDSRNMFYEKLKNYDIKYILADLNTGSLKQKEIEGSEVDKHYFNVTTKRHNPEYYRLLNETLLFSTIGGYTHIRPLDFFPFSRMDKIRKMKYKIQIKLGANYHKTHFIFQWDSFRLWECFYSNTCPVNFSFDSWGFILPEMPQNGVHYLGIDGVDFKKFTSQLNSLSVDEIKTIGMKGKKWALEHYSPIAQAQRLLKAILL